MISFEMSMSIYDFVVFCENDSFLDRLKMRSENRKAKINDKVR